MIKIAPSILSANFSNLGDDILKLEKYDADMIHIDVMDGMFVPNISFGIPVIKSIRNVTKLPFDVHLMIEDPSRYINDFANAGADIITVHYEADRHVDRTISYIKSLGLKGSIALNPATPVCVLENIISNLDMVLIMSVNPGFSGQKYIDYCSKKISDLREMANKYNPNLIIEVDGGIDKDNIKYVADSGVDIAVAGSSVFKDGNIKGNISDLKKMGSK